MNPPSYAGEIATVAEATCERCLFKSCWRPPVGHRERLDELSWLVLSGPAVLLVDQPGVQSFTAPWIVVGLLCWHCVHVVQVRGLRDRWARRVRRSLQPYAGAIWDQASMRWVQVRQ